jgi:hypothetical protein
VSGSDVAIGVLAILLVVDLLVIPWFSLEGVSHLSGPGTIKATHGPGFHYGLAIAAIVSAAIVLVGLLVDIGASGARILTRLAAVATLALLGTKFGLDVHELVRQVGGAHELKFFGLGAWVGVVAAVLIVIVALVPRKRAPAPGLT